MARRERDAQFKARFESDQKGLAEVVRYEASLQVDPVAGRLHGLILFARMSAYRALRLALLETFVCCCVCVCVMMRLPTTQRDALGAFVCRR